MIRLHGQNQTFLRYTQKFFFKLAHQHVRALDQRGDLIEQRVVVNRRDTAADVCGSSGQLANNLGAALGEAGNDCAVSGKRSGIAVGMLQHHRVKQRFKPVAVRGVAGLQAQGVDSHNVTAMQGNQTMRGPHELHVGPAVGQLVSHDFGDRQLGNRLQQGFLQALSQRCAFDCAVIKQRLGFAVYSTF